MSTELLDYYVGRAKELEQASKWLRLWVTCLSVNSIVNPQRIDRINCKIGYSMTRLFNLLD